MPKIVRNEIEYSSTTSTANQINYLNTTSGLSATNVQDAIDELESGKADKSTIVKYFDLTISSTNADSGIPPFNYYGQNTKTDSTINNILGCSVYDTQFNNPAICAFYSQSGSTYNFIVYSGRSGNVKIRVMYN